MNPSVRKDDKRFLELLDRWMRGDFTRNDEQELHALTDADEFRREAWEGLTALPEEDHAARLGALREKLSGPKPNGRVFVMPPWLAAAAALALLIVAVWWFAPWRPQPDQPIAGAKPDNTAETPLSTSPDAEKSTADIDQNTPADNEYPPLAANRATAKQMPSMPAPTSDQIVMATESKAESVEDAATPAEENAKSAPVASAPAGAPATSPASQSEAGDKKTSTGNPRDTFDTDTKPDMAAVRKLDSANTQPEPAKGWDDFSEYLRQNARLTAEARNNNISGTVRIQFAVDNNGAPYGFQILKGLGYGCDQEAIRLINEYDWTPGRQPRAIDIRFVR